MFKNHPLLRVAARATFVGFGAFLGALVAKLPGVSLDELLFAANAGYIAAASYAGFGVFTDLEPTVGVKGK